MTYDRDALRVSQLVVRAKRGMLLVATVLMLCTSMTVWAGTDPYLANDAALQATEKVTLTGTVVDDLGEPLIGVRVAILGTPDGTVTDLDGNYKLSLPAKPAKIEFSYVGMKTYVYEFDGKTTTHNVKMLSDVQMIEELVVVGYGSKERKSLTSSISSVDKDQLETLSATAPSVDNMLGGVVKGVLVRQTSGEPGVGSVINVRGFTSPFPNMSSNQESNVPLYVIDGVPTFVESNSMNPLLALSPNDIASIDVLKDAAATAIYGSRGSNGVIIVNTKKGNKGDRITSQFSYNLSVGNPVKRYNVLNRDEFLQLQDLIFSNTFQDYKMDFITGEMPRTFLDPTAAGNFAILEENMDFVNMFQEIKYKGLKMEAYGKENIDWQREVQNVNALTHQYSYSVNGGGDKTDYMLSLNGTNQEGLYVKEGFKRYSARVSVNSNLSRRARVGAILNYAYSFRNGSEGESIFNQSRNPWNYRPDLPIYDENGAYLRASDGGISQGIDVYGANPLALREKDVQYKSDQVMGNVYFELNILDDLKFRSDFNFGRNLFDNRNFSPVVSQDAMPAFKKTEAELTTTTSNTLSTSLNFRLDYNKRFRDNHDFSAMIGYGGDRYKSASVMHMYEGFPDDRLSNVSSARQMVLKYNQDMISALNSIYSRLSYSYMSKYLVELSMRGDKSSKFGPNHKWGYFPALSLGWRFSEERFVQDKMPWVSDGKLRLSYGKTGSTNVADFSYKQYFESSQSTNYMGKYTAVIRSLFPNPDVRWEMTSEYNAGLDFALFNNRVYGNLDLYYRYTDGALAPSPHMMEAGLPTYYANIIDVSNRGVEFQIGADVIKKKTFLWSTSFNISANRNKIESLNNASIDVYMQDSFLEGEPVGSVLGYVVDKIAQTQEDVDKVNKLAVDKGNPYFQDQYLRVGDYIFKDLNGDGIITRADRTVIANSQADFFGGWTNTFRYKNFSINALLQFVMGGKALWEPIMEDLAGSINRNISREVFEEIWTPDNRNGRYAAPVAQSNSLFKYYLCDRHVFDVSYARLKNITLQYDTAPKFMESLGVRSLSLSLSASNLFTITKWPGLDPELLGSGAVGMSSSKDPYPLSRTFTMGVKAIF